MRPSRRLALVGWATDSGVGRELIDAVRHLPVSSVFALENPFKPTRKDLLLGTPAYFATAANQGKQMELFLECHRPDTILTWETPGAWTFPAIWQRKGVRWIHMVHWDWLSASQEHLSLLKTAKLLAPNMMCQRELKQNYDLESTLIPVPVDTDRLVFRERKRAETFISVYGYGGLEDRRSILEILEAWKKMPGSAKLVIKAQKKPDEIKGALPNGVSIELGNVPEPADLYKVGDVALQLSRYEGVGVSMIEAQASGIPVVAIDAPPMNEIVCGPRIQVAKVVQISIMSKTLPSYIPSVQGLADAILRLHGSDISELSRQAWAWAEEKFSWKALREKWVSVLSENVASIR